MLSVYVVLQVADTLYYSVYIFGRCCLKEDLLDSFIVAEYVHHKLQSCKHVAKFYNWKVCSLDFCFFYKYLVPFLSKSLPLQSESVCFGTNWLCDPWKLSFNSQFHCCFYKCLFLQPQCLFCQTPCAYLWNVCSVILNTCFQYSVVQCYKKSIEKEVQ